MYIYTSNSSEANFVKYVLDTSVKEIHYIDAKYWCQINKPLIIIRNRPCVGLWFSINPPQIRNHLL